MAFETPETQVYTMFVGYFGRPPAPDGLQFFVDVLENNEDGLAVLFDDFWQAPETQENYAGLSLAESVDQVFNQLFGRDALPEGREFWVGEIEAGRTSLPALAADVAFSAEEGEGADADVLNAKIATSMLWTDSLDTQAELDAFATETGRQTARDFLSTITSDQPASQAAVDDAIASMPIEPPEPGETQTLWLTQQADNYTGADAGEDGVDTTFEAPVTQNETGSGELANTFETGDRLDGGTNSTNSLDAVLIATGTIGDNNPGAAISATTTNIQNVYLRAQTPQVDTASNTTFVATVDAEKMEAVAQWWTDGSRSDIRLEDIRTRPIDTDFGMRETDPAVSYEAYFNPLYMQGESGAALLTLQIAEITDGAVDTDAELANIDVSALRFGFNDEELVLDFEAFRTDEGRITKWAESGEGETPSLLKAIEAKLTEMAAEDGPEIEVSYQGDGTYLLSTRDGAFTNQGGFTAQADTDGQIDIRNVIRIGADEAEPTETDLILDGAGNGSLGGIVNLAAMSGDRGIEVINVDVDRSSHITSLSSVNSPNTGGTRSFDSENQLEEVNVNHRLGGSQGDLQIGLRTVDVNGASTTIDDRLQTQGLTDVRVFDASGFDSEIKLGAQLTDQVFTKYLDPAEDTVQFSYLLGDGGNNLSLDVNGEVSRDVDFALEIVGGASDDRINLTGTIDPGNGESRKSTISIDGGDGVNTVSLDSTTANDVENGSGFGAFANIARLVVEGTNDTVQNADTGNMAGLSEVVIATDDRAATATAPRGVNTTLSSLDPDTDIIVNGKNQTLGTGNSNNNQYFGLININGSPETNQVVELHNYARFDGQLVVHTLGVDRFDDGDDPISNVDTVTIHSVTRLDRDQSNAVTNLRAGSAEEVVLTGNKDLGVNVMELATKPINPAIEKPLKVDGSALEANLTLGFLASLNQEGNDDELVGTANESDTLALHGDLGANVDAGRLFNASVSEFEKVQFGYNANLDVADALGGLPDVPGLPNPPVADPAATSGIYDAGNDGGVGTYQIANIDNNLTLQSLSSGINVVLGEKIDSDPNTNEQQDLAGTITLDGNEDQSDINLQVLKELDLDNAVGAVGAGYDIDINEYRTINIAVDHAVPPLAADDHLVLNLNLDPVARASQADPNVEDIPTRAQALNIDAQVGVDLQNAQFVDGMSINTGSGDDLIDMSSADSLTVDAGAGADVFYYQGFNDSPTGDRDTILNFTSSGEEADNLDVTDVVANLGDFDLFTFLGSVSGTDGDVNRKFAQLSTGFGDNVLKALYDTDRGELFFDTNGNRAIAGVDGQDLSIKMPSVSGLSNANFTADNALGGTVIAESFTLRALLDLTEDELDALPYIVLADSAQNLLASPDQTREAAARTTNNEVVVTGEPTDDERIELDQLGANEEGNIGVEYQIDAEPGDVEPTFTVQQAINVLGEGEELPDDYVIRDNAENITNNIGADEDVVTEAGTVRLLGPASVLQAADLLALPNFDRDDYDLEDSWVEFSADGIQNILAGAGTLTLINDPAEPIVYTEEQQALVDRLIEDNPAFAETFELESNVFSVEEALAEEQLPEPYFIHDTAGALTDEGDGVAAIVGGAQEVQVTEPTTVDLAGQVRGLNANSIYDLQDSWEAFSADDNQAVVAGAGMLMLTDDPAEPIVYSQGQQGLVDRLIEDNPAFAETFELEINVFNVADALAAEQLPEPYFIHDTAEALTDEGDGVAAIVGGAEQVQVTEPTTVDLAGQVRGLNANSVYDLEDSWDAFSADDNQAVVAGAEMLMLTNDPAETIVYDEGQQALVDRLIEDNPAFADTFELSGGEGQFRTVVIDPDQAVDGIFTEDLDASAEGAERGFKFEGDSSELSATSIDITNFTAGQSIDLTDLQQGQDEFSFTVAADETELAITMLTWTSGDFNTFSTLGLTVDVNGVDADAFDGLADAGGFDAQVDFVGTVLNEDWLVGF